MTLLRYSAALILVAQWFAVAANAQSDKPFPSDEEIELVLTQTERALQQYKPLIDQEEIQMGKGYAEAAAKDRRVLNALEMAVKAFKSKPQGFNGPLGFAFFEWLDDADRNALLCSSGASTQFTLHIVAGEKDRADALLRLSQSCTDVSTLIYTVSENAGSLYQRYAEAEGELAAQSAEVARKCTDIVKRNNLQPRK